MLDEQPNEELELRDYLLVLRRRRAIVAVTVAVTVGMALLVSFIQTPVYSAAARMRIQPRPGLSPFDSPNQQGNESAQFVATEIEVVKGDPVRDEVRRRLGSAPAVTVRPVGNTAVVEVTAASTDPERAAAVANAYVDAYIANRRQQGVDDSLAAQKEVQSKIDLLQDQIDALGGDPNTAQAQRQALVQQQALFKSTLDELQVTSALITGGAEFVRSATVPVSPVKPTPLRNGVLALVVGSLLGVGLAFLVDYLDDTIKGREDLELLTGSVPVIGEIPEVTGWKTTGSTRVVAATSSQSAAAEAYRALRTAIDFIAIDHPMHVVQVTSPNASEGKTTTLANLAVTMAMAGKRVVVVCCDLRRPRVHDFFGLSNAVGFTSTLLGDRPVSTALQAVPGIPRLRLLASGPMPPNPSELLSSQRTGDILASLASDADLVLIDSPPVLPVTDALVLFRHVNATLMVFSAGKTTRKDAAAAIAKVRQVDGPLVGAVLNGVEADARYGYGYRYESETPPSRRRFERNGAAKHQTARNGAAKNAGVKDGAGGLASSSSKGHRQDPRDRPDDG